MSNVIPFGSLLNRARMFLTGVSFHGKRDLYELFGWHRLPEFPDFIGLYYRHPIAKRIVNQPALSMWGDPPQLQAQAEFNTAWEEICQTSSLFSQIIRLDKLAGLGRYAVMVVGFDDGRQLDQPVRVKPGRKVIYLQPYHEGAAKVIEFETDNTSPRFGLPTMYNINPGRFVIDGRTVTQNPHELRQPFRVHWSRVIHVAEGLLEDNIFGASRIECVYNDLCDLMKVSGGASEMFWMIANRGMQVDVDKEMELDAESEKTLSQEIEDYQHQLRRFIRTRGVKINALGSDPIDPTATYEILLKNISTGSGIPQVTLMGVSSGQAASQQDRAVWSERVAERVTEYGQPRVLKPTIDCFVAAGVLPEPLNLVISWPEAFKLNPFERAQTSAQMARSAANMAKAHMAMAPKDSEGNPQSTQPLFTTEEMRRIVSFGRHPPVFDSPQASGDVPSPGLTTTSPPSGSGSSAAA